MELHIGSPVTPAPFVPNSFEVHVTVMHGDADLYQTFVVPGFDAGSQVQVELLKDLLRTLDKMEAVFKYTGRGVEKEERYGFYVPEFEPWFSTEDLTKDYNHALYKPNSASGTEHLMSLAREVNSHYQGASHLEWPKDLTMGDEFGHHNETTLGGYEVFYINEQGQAFNVSVDAAE